MKLKASTEAPFGPLNPNVIYLQAMTLDLNEQFNLANSEWSFVKFVPRGDYPQLFASGVFLLASRFFERFSDFVPSIRSRTLQQWAGLF
jgi:hypothetical protein